MKLTNKFLLLIAALALPAAPAAAAPELALTWDEARKLAMQHNPSVKAARASKEQASSSYLASLNSYLPSVSVSHGLSRSGGDSRDPSNSWSASISASEDLLNLRTVSSVRSSRISKEKSEAD